MAFQIIRNDITKVSADAIVNTANPKPICGSGTEYAIYTAAGYDKLLAERRRIGNIAEGQAVSTPAFDLPAKYIIHTVGPIWRDGVSSEFDTLKACYENSLKLALDLGCESIAFPLMASGTNGFPKDRALQVAMNAIQAFLMEHEMTIILVVFDKKAFELSGRVVDNIREYVDSHDVERARAREYRFHRDHSERAWFASQRKGTAYEEHEAYGAYREPAQNVYYASRERVEEDEAPNAPSGLSVPEESIRYNSAQVVPECDSAQVVPVCDSAQAVPESDRVQAAPACDRPQSAPMPAAASVSQKCEKPRIFGKKVDIDKLVASSEKTFQEKLFEIIDTRGLTGPQVYKNYISKQVYSKIQADRNYHPNKYTALALCLSLHLSLEETKDLMGRAGWSLSPSNKPDIVVTGCILNGEYNPVHINLLLFDYDCPELEKIK